MNFQELKTEREQSRRWMEKAHVLAVAKETEYLMGINECLQKKLSDLLPENRLCMHLYRDINAVNWILFEDPENVMLIVLGDADLHNQSTLSWIDRIQTVFPYAKLICLTEDDNIKCGRYILRCAGTQSCCEMYMMRYEQLVNFKSFYCDSIVTWKQRRAQECAV